MNQILPLDTDILNTNRFSVVGLGMALKAILGDGPNVDGLTCTPSTGLAVNIGPGAIYSIGPVEAIAYDNLPADTSDRIINQGLVWGQTELALLDASTTIGQSTVWLIEAQFQKIDGAPIYVPYHNQANNSPLLTPINTVRQGVCVLKAKQGAAAATGTEILPAADEGWTPLYAITIAHGVTSIAIDDIVVSTGAPFIGTKLPQAAPIDSPTFIGTPTVPTPATDDSSMHAVNTVWVRDRLVEFLDSPAFTGVPTTPTPASGDSSTQVTNTEWVKQRLTESLDSPVFTGTPTAPTPAASDSSKQLATTEWVKERLANKTSQLIRQPRTTNIKLVAADSASWIDITSGNFTQTFDTPVALGNGWYVRIRNSGTGIITIPSSDGFTNWCMYPNEERIFQCDGEAFTTSISRAFTLVSTVSGTFNKPPGYSAYALWVFGAGSGGGGGGGGSTGASIYNTGGSGGAGGGAGDAGQVLYIANLSASILQPSTDYSCGSGGSGANGGIGAIGWGTPSSIGRAGASSTVSATGGGASTFGAMFSALGGAGNTTANGSAGFVGGDSTGTGGASGTPPFGGTATLTEFGILNTNRSTPGSGASAWVQQGAATSASNGGVGAVSIPPLGAIGGMVATAAAGGIYNATGTAGNGQPGVVVTGIGQGGNGGGGGAGGSTNYPSASVAYSAGNGGAGSNGGPGGVIIMGKL